MQEQQQQEEQVVEAVVAVEVGQLVVLVVVPKAAEVQVLQESPGFQPFRLVPSFVLFFQRFVKRRLRKGVTLSRGQSYTHKELSRNTTAT